jgi:hypothetical protein
MTTGNSTIKYYGIIAKLVEDCYVEENVDKKLRILNKINSIIPKSCCINVPPWITNDYIDTALYKIEENVRSAND